MMIIAVLISGMLMPAQIFAKNDRREVKKENRVSVDYNRANKGGNVAKNHKQYGHQSKTAHGAKYAKHAIFHTVVSRNNRFGAVPRE